jgi:hypothetical protein
VTRIEWTRTEPGDIEHLVAMLLCRENPAATHIRPSRGDGGIDVLVPADDGSGIIVYQVKSFHSNLTASQKAQVERSFHRLVDFAKAHDLKVLEWYLTLPLDPTTENLLDWLADLTAGHDLTVGWRGLNFLDGLAGTYPSVVDYYLHDGKERLQAALESLTAVLRMNLNTGSSASEAGAPAPAPTGPLAASEAVEGLASLHAALNEQDPHFYYDFSVDTVRPDVPDQPGLVAAVQHGDDTRCITFKIFARCNASLVERPVPMNIKITADPDSDLHGDIQVFEKYGKPLTTPAGSTEGNLDLPGGLGGAFTGGSISIGPAKDAGAEPYDLRLQLLDQTDALLTETLVHMKPLTTGLRRRGVRAHGTEQHGAFTFEALTDLDAQTSNISLGPTDLTGGVPSLLLPGLRLLREFRHPNQLRVAAPFGATTAAPLGIPDDIALDPDAGTVFDLVEALAIIQEHTSTQIRVPDLTKLTHRDARRILYAAEVLRGEAISVPWDVRTVHLNPGAGPPPTEPVTMLLFEKLNISVNGARVDLGYQQVHLPAVRIDLNSLTNHDDHQDVRIVPVGGTPAIIRFAPELPVAPS